MSKYLITAALPYANGPIHIGHLAGCYLPADIYSRYLRLQNRDIKFICGSDEHGVAITIRARKEGKTPREIVDYMVDESLIAYLKNHLTLNPSPTGEGLDKVLDEQLPSISSHTSQRPRTRDQNLS